MGGPFFLVSEEIFKDRSIDIMIKGEGEDNFPEVIERIKSKKPLSGISGVSYKENGFIQLSEDFLVTQRLEDLPMLDHDIYFSKYKTLDRPTKYFIRSRGCPYNCTFCGNVFITQVYDSKKKKGFRVDTNYQKLFDEINYVKDTYGLKWVQFVDSNFNTSIEETKVFLNEYIKAKMPPYICNIRADNIDEEIVRLLKVSGCDRVTIGVQSGVPRIQRIAGRLTPNQKILDVAGFIRKYNIRLGVDMIVGWPGETIDEMWQSIDFVRKMRPEYVNVQPLVLFPKTKIAEYAYENNFIQKLPEIDDFIEPFLNTKDLPSTRSMFSDVNVMRDNSPASLKISNEIKNLTKLFEFAVFHPKQENFVKFLAKRTKWVKIINMINAYPAIKRSFKYDTLSLRGKLKKILWLLSL